MNQQTHLGIALFLFVVTWELLLKHYMILPEERKFWDDYFDKKFFGE